MIRPQKITSYNAFKQRFQEAGFKGYRLAKELGITPSSVTNFFACRHNKISKRNFLLIRYWLIEHGIIIPKPSLRCTCPTCGKVHVQKKGTLSPECARLMDAAAVMMALRDKWCLSRTRKIGTHIQKQ